MPLDLKGISNEQEFYTDYYLATELEKNLAPVFVRWSGAGDSPLRGAPKGGPGMGGDVRGTRAHHRSAARLACQRAWLRQLVGALGYPCEHGVRAGEDGVAVPIAGEVAAAGGKPELWLIEAVDASNELADPLTLPIVREQMPAGEDLKWPEEETRTCISHT